MKVRPESPLSSSDSDVARWRSDTPGCERVTHLNNAGAALMPRVVVDTMKEHLDAEMMRGGYEAADDAADRVRATYESVADLCAAPQQNIALVESATAGVALIVDSFAWRPGDRVVTTRNDYASNQIMLIGLAERYGVEILRAEDAPEGGVDPASFGSLLERDGVKLALATWIPTNSGLMQPVAALGALCEGTGIPFAIDACQAVGQVPIDVGELRCDFLTASARKFLRGPRGVGFLYVSNRALDRGRHPLLADMRGADWIDADAIAFKPGARRYEWWEFAYALVLGLGAAARYALDAGIARVSTRAHGLAAALRERLAAIGGVRLMDRGREQCAIVSFVPGTAPAADIVAELRVAGINASWTPRTSATIDLDEKGVPAVVRLSPHYYNTVEELDRAVEALAKAISARKA